MRSKQRRRKQDVVPGRTIDCLRLSGCAGDQGNPVRDSLQQPKHAGSDAVEEDVNQGKVAVNRPMWNHYILNSPSVIIRVSLKLAVDMADSILVL